MQPMTDVLKTVWWDDVPCLIDQLRLPATLDIVRCEDLNSVIEAIRSMQVRGAPAIGITAAYGMALAAKRSTAQSTAKLLEKLAKAKSLLDAARPTAINLAWATQRMLDLAQANGQLEPDQLRQRLLAEAETIRDQDEAMCRAIGQHGKALLAKTRNVLTHCNAGGLATAAYGTALAPIRAVHEDGQPIHVWVDETRPFLQGARLTAWELQQAGIDLTLITDNMAAYFMQQGHVDCIIVGSDRIAANGDVANKIGTYGLAVLAKAHNIPLYVAAPTSTIDLQTANGAAIPIEQRSSQEVTHIGQQAIAAPGIKAAHPAFDVTPAHLVTAIITEQGIAYPPFVEQLHTMVEAANAANARQ